MNLNEACRLMIEGKPVQSLVSYTTYEMTADGLLAEGQPAAQRASEDLNDFVWRLGRDFDIYSVEYDNDLSSPDSGEVEWDYYEILDEDGE